MLKISLYDRGLRNRQLVNKSLFGETYRLMSGEYLKVFNDSVRFILNADHSLEAKIMQAKPIPDVPEIIIPSRAVFDSKNSFVGYVTPPAPGVDFNSYDANYTIEQRNNLVEYGQIFSTITDAVRRANGRGIVFPDLCTCDNIFIHNGRVSFIDYDGIQVGRHKVYAMSTTLGDEDGYYNAKYMKNGLFTPELDKKSIVLLYFLSAFNINLNRIGQLVPGTGSIITLEEIFNMLGLKDDAFMKKVCKTLSMDEPGEYIDEDIMRIAHEYEMESYGPVMGNYYFKKLRKK